MRKFVLVALALVFLSSSAWAGLATITRTEYGYSVTGGVSNTAIAVDTWVTAIAYTKNETVIVSGMIYKCQVAHTSGTFATDLAAAYWVATQYATLWVSGISHYASTATDVSEITTGQSSGVSSGVSAFSILNTGGRDFSDPNGVQFVNPRIKLKAATDVLYIYVKRQNF